ncbi:MAG: HzsA-related protein [Acidobacteriaceae bacterium]
MKRFWSTLAAGFFLVLCAMHEASGATEAPSESAAPAHPQTYPALAFIEAPIVTAGDLTRRFPQGSRLARMTPGVQPSPVVPLTPEFFAAADPQVSFDGSRILFSAQQRKSADWQIWEMAVDGSAQRQVTHCPGDCLEPKYLPRNRIVYTFVSGNGSVRSSTVEVCQMDGKGAHPITFGPGNFQVETVLRSGRILVSAESPLLAGGSPHRSRTLFTLRPDGSGLALLRDDGNSGESRGGAIELADGTIVFLEAKNATESSSGGQLASVRQGALRTSTLTRPPSEYVSTEQMDDATLVVARKNSAHSASRNFDLYSFDLASKSLGGLLYQNAKASSVQAIPLAPHPLPEIYWSILHPTAQTGRILCLDSYISQDVASGRLAGRIARVRVLTLQQPGNRERVVGDALVESDGSFYATVPADVPIRFELLGRTGEVLHAQRSWIWVRNGEDRGCQGCHDSPALAPANHFPLALLRFDTPTPLDGTLHAQRPGQPRGDR